MKVMKPIVAAMDILQSKTSYIGHIVPTVFGLQRKLTAVSDRSVKPLAEALAMVWKQDLAVCSKVMNTVWPQHSFHSLS